GALPPFGQAADRPRARGGQALERLHQRRPRLGLTVWTDPLEPQCVPQRRERLLGLAARDPPPAELRVRPPESLIDLFATFGRQRLGRDRREQILRALERLERVGLAPFLQAADRMRGELAHLAAEGPGEHRVESL